MSKFSAQEVVKIVTDALLTIIRRSASSKTRSAQLVDTLRYARHLLYQSKHANLYWRFLREEDASSKAMASMLAEACGRGRNKMAAKEVAAATRTEGNVVWIVDEMDTPCGPRTSAAYDATMEAANQCSGLSHVAVLIMRWHERNRMSLTMDYRGRPAMRVTKLEVVRGTFTPAVPVLNPLLLSRCGSSRVQTLLNHPVTASDTNGAAATATFGHWWLRVGLEDGAGDGGGAGGVTWVNIDATAAQFFPAGSLRNRNRSVPLADVHVWEDGDDPRYYVADSVVCMGEDSDIMCRLHKMFNGDE